MVRRKRDRLRWFWEEDDFIEPFRQMQRDFNRQFRNFLQPLQTFPMDLSETNTEVVIRADLPGFKKDEINVEAYETKILISAKKKKEKVEQKENFYRRERSAGELRRIITLPAEVDISKAKVNFLEGVLEIKLPKKEKKKEKKVKLL
jgi:HSP20 family protein